MSRPPAEPPEPPTNAPGDESAFERRYAELSIVDRLLARGVPPVLVPVALPAALFLTGTGVSAAYGYLETYVTSGSSLVLCVNFAIFLATILWADRRGPSVIVEIRPVFDVDDERYYGFFGQLVELAYEPFPWAGHSEGGGRWIHPPTAAAFVGLAALLVVFAEVTPLLSALTRTDWPTLPVGLKVFLLLQFLVPIGALVLVGWIVAVLVAFMGVRVASLPLKLDPTRGEFHLGLEPYSRLVLRVGYAYLVLLTTTGIFVIQAPEPTLLLVYGFLSVVPIVGVVGGNYGLHRAIVKAKKRRLAALRDAHDDELRRWFVGSVEGPEPDRSPEHLLAVKREIEALPDWPFDLQRFVELGLLAVVSNLSILYRIVPA